jgi:hypothetical protein
VQSKEKLLSRFHRVLSPVLQADEAPVEIRLHPGQLAALQACEACSIPPVNIEAPIPVY